MASDNTRQFKDASKTGVGSFKDLDNDYSDEE
jgi:hypothetical protein